MQLRWHCYVLALCPLFCSAAHAQTEIDAEIKRFQGDWQVSELVDDGRVIPPAEFRNWLPSGGRIEIVDTAILFTSPLDGKKSAKSYSIDPTIYPKQIRVTTRESVEGVGIYRFDNERLVICVADPSVAALPAEFSARKGSKRMVMTLERGNKPATEQLVDLPAPPRETPNPPDTAGRILTDAEVTTLLQGTWRLNDGLGLLDVTFSADLIFRSFREVRDLSTFHNVFVQSPVSSGTWSVKQGQLILHTTASTTLAHVNQNLQIAVRSISATDFIFVDHLGRVGQAVKLR